MVKKTNQLNVRIAEDDRSVLNLIDARHGLSDAVLVRAFLAEVRRIYQKEGWFGLPFTVTLNLPEPQPKNKRARKPRR